MPGISKPANRLLQRIDQSENYIASLLNCGKILYLRDKIGARDGAGASVKVKIRSG